MKMTFPHMGTTYIPVKMILDELNIEAVLPPKSNKRTLALGIKCSPEAICVPFKIIMGNILEGIEMGADSVFMLTGCGPCRFGIFHALQYEIMKDMGKEVEFITADRFSSIQGLKEFMDRLKEASHKNGYLRILRTIRKGYRMLHEVDSFHDLCNQIRPREIQRGMVDHLYTQFEDTIRKAFGYHEMMLVLKDYKEKLKHIQIDKTKSCVKIGLIGEIYTILETYINLNIERKLGNMGVEVVRMASASEFVKEQMDFLPFVRSEKKVIYEAASKYMETPIGGHAIHSIGNIMRNKSSCDGFIHLLPFTCMPEIVVQSMLPKIEREEDVPIITLVLDEMTGEAGYLTRIEAFIDLVKQRKEFLNEGTSLSWY